MHKIEIIQQIQCFIFDIDGTMCLGNTLIKGADKMIEYLRTNNIQHYFFTNNSSKNPSLFVQKLDKLGIANDGIQSILTSGDVTAKYITGQKPNAKIYVCGTNALKQQLESYGIEIVPSYGEKIDFAVLGFDTELDYQKLTHLTDYLADDVPYLATNIDDICPLEGGRNIVDCGSMAKMIQNATGKTPKFLGKPQKETTDFIVNLTGCERNKIAIVGDRLYTDIKTAANGDMVSIAVLSGEMTALDIKNSEFKPDFIFDSAKEILEELVK